MISSVTSKVMSIAAAAALGLGGPLLAQETAAPGGVPAATQAAGTLDLIAGSGTVFAPATGVTRLALADETLATVTMLSAREVLLHGTKPGTTTLFVWLENGERQRYDLRVRHDLSALLSALQEIDKRITVDESPDCQTVMIRGEVDDVSIALAAGVRAETFLKSGGAGKGPALANLLKYPTVGKPLNSDVQLALALQGIDSRIRVRRIQVTGQSEAKSDSYILEGRVKTIADLNRAVILAERQLGGTGLQLKVADNTRIQMSRMLGNTAAMGGGGGNLQNLTDDPSKAQNSTANHLARKLIVSSESGRVVSFLEVDQIDQILVAIRVFEIDRNKSRGLGLNYRIDGEHFSVGHYTANTASRLPVQYGKAADVSGAAIGNLVGAYVDDSSGIIAAMDFMQEKQVARAVATPNVLTLTGEKASVVVGGELPIPTTSIAEVAAIKGFSFQSFGVRLDIRPTTTDDGIITLEVAPSIIRPDDKLSVDGVPGFKVESVETTARVKTGQSLVLGGLLNYEEGVTERKVPLLGDIPLLGYLFKWQGRSRSERELVFVITPNLLANAAEGTKGTLELPSNETLDDGLSVEHTPQTLEPDGRPTLWTKPNPQPVPKAARNPATDGALFRVEEPADKPALPAEPKMEGSAAVAPADKPATP